MFAKGLDKPDKVLMRINDKGSVDATYVAVRHSMYNMYKDTLIIAFLFFGFWELTWGFYNTKIGISSSQDDIIFLVNNKNFDGTFRLYSRETQFLEYKFENRNLKFELERCSEWCSGYLLFPRVVLWY